MTNETEVKERPIIFTDWSVQRILSGNKTQTRRVVKPQPEDEVMPCHYTASGWAHARSGGACTCRGIRGKAGRPGDVGNRLWVREAYTYWEDPETGEDYLEYCADGTRRSFAEWEYPHDIYDHCGGKFDKRQTPLFMPRWASRITLEITELRCEQLQDITEADAEAEGCEDLGTLTAKAQYRRVWDEIHTKKQKDGLTWDKNPWVWVTEFQIV